MAQGKADKPVTIDELRSTTSTLQAWRSGALARLAGKQARQVIRREARRNSGTLVVDCPPPSKRNNRHG